MIGEKIAELTGRTTARRVITGPNGPKMEVSMEQAGKILGIELMDFATYESVFDPLGHLEGRGQGIGMTKDGERVTWTGTGIGRFNGKGGVQWRGSIHYRTSSPKLSKLNGHCFVFEFDTDDGGNTHGRIYEWK
jgi:hypothetical protein